MKQQEHALLTHDALRAWELCGLKAEILKARLIGYDNRKWHQLEAQGALVYKSWEWDDCCMWFIKDGAWKTT